MDYSKMKVVELKELLTSRNLPPTGKKEELIARLTAADAAKDDATDPTEDAPAVAPHLAPPEDEVDWEKLENDNAPAPATTGAGAAPPVEKKEIKKDTAPEVTQPTTSTSDKQVPVEDKKKFSFKKISDEFDAPSAEIQKDKVETNETDSVNASTKAVDTEKFSAGMSASNLNDEVEKRKARAARFGVAVDDSVKALERSLRFATTSDDVSKGNQPQKAIRNLDRALGEGRDRKRSQENTNNSNRKRSRGTPQAEKKDKPKGVMEDPTEKAKAEARAKRFGNT